MAQTIRRSDCAEIYEALGDPRATLARELADEEDAAELRDLRALAERVRPTISVGPMAAEAALAVVVHDVVGRKE